MFGKFIINNKPLSFEFSPDETLLTSLRKNGFTEVKNGCSEGQCGACVVLINDKLINSCQVFTASVIEHKITTVKGVGDIHTPHIIQQAFVDAGAVQCGFCTPGMVLATYYLLNNNDTPNDNEIIKSLNGNLCRCTGYVKIIEAVKLAALRMKKDAWFF